ncbi:MAG: choloylglycine hydrolase family protein [Pseudomonadota bacterium]
MTRKLRILSTYVLLMVLPFSQQLIACTAITLIAADGSLIQARTQEWGPFDLRSQVMFVSRGTDLVGTTPDGKPGLAWAAKYGVIGVNANDLPVFVDGMNEKGLAVSVLYLPGFSEFQTYMPSEASNTISGAEVSLWILTTLESVEEVKTELPKINAVDVKLPSFGNIAPPIHLMVSDGNGESIVVEYTDGNLDIYDNPVGVMTNSPSFPWHLTNLRNYVGLQPQSANPVTVGKLEITPIGVGSGMLGLPGDYTPPSRFIRAAALRNTAVERETGEEVVFESFRILDNFNIPSGSTAARDEVPTDGTLGSTQWTTATDTKGLQYYYHTMANRTLRKIDLRQVDFSQGGIRFFPLDSVKEQTVEMVDINGG